MNEMVERVVRQIWMCHTTLGLDGPEGERYAGELARSIIWAALREPTEAMIKAGTDSIGWAWSDGGMDDDAAAETWKAMIDAALKD